MEPRLGLAWDLTGDGKTAIRASAGVFHNTRVSGNVNWQASRNPPLQLNPQIFYGTMATLLQSTGSTFPSTVQGFDKNIETPTLYSYTAGVQRDIGWRTVLDVAYVGSQTDHLLQTINLNTVPYGARFDPANQDPTRPGNPLPDNFFRPYPGYGDINYFLNNGIANYNALQVQANRRFSHGLQFGVAYTFSRSRDYTSATETGTTPGRLPTYSDVREWTYGLSSFDQTHVAVINYTYDLPKVSSLWNNVVVRAVLDDWQISGITAFSSGTPSGVALALQDSATDLTGGGDGTRVVVTGDPVLSRGDRIVHALVRHVRLRASPAWRCRERPQGHHQASRSQQHGHHAVQALPVQRRASERADPMGGLQSLQPHAVQRHRHHRSLCRNR